MITLDTLPGRAPYAPRLVSAMQGATISALPRLSEQELSFSAGLRVGKAWQDAVAGRKPTPSAELYYFDGRAGARIELSLADAIETFTLKDLDEAALHRKNRALTERARLITSTIPIYAAFFLTPAVRQDMSRAELKQGRQLQTGDRIEKPVPCYLGMLETLSGTKAGGFDFDASGKPLHLRQYNTTLGWLPVAS